MIKVGSKVTLVKVRVDVGRLVTLNLSTTARCNTWFFRREIHKTDRLVYCIAIPDPAAN
jgi:hypothetical protein